MRAGDLTSNHTEALAGLVSNHGGVLITGRHGLGKSHLLRALGALSRARGLEPVTVSGSPAARQVPLAAFSAALRSQNEPLTPGSVIAALTRRRSRTLLIVDAVELLDEPSQLIVGHLLRTAGIATAMSARRVEACPPEVRALYDAGIVVEAPLRPLPDAAMSATIEGWLDGPVTPGAEAALLTAAQGNPLIAREIVTATTASGILRRTDHGWDTSGPVQATPRVSEVIGAQLGLLDDDAVDAVGLVALADALPPWAIAEELHRPLLRTGLITRDDDGWLRSSQPLLAAAVRATLADAHWEDIARHATALLDHTANEVPDRRRELRHRASVIALEHGLPFDPERWIALAEHALAASDAALALRATDAATRVSATGDMPSAGWRVRGQAASTLGFIDQASSDLARARATSRTDEDSASAALALASHVGIAHRDARQAVQIIAGARAEITSDTWIGHLDRALVRWSSIAGDGSVDAGTPREPSDAEAVMGLAVLATGAVVSGPLSQAHALTARFRALPETLVAQAPGAAALNELASIMALSYTGDVKATRTRLLEQIELARRIAPETRGGWEYALGVVELFAGDAGEAHQVASDAVEHLRWRDPLGLIAAAEALLRAAATGAGIEGEALPAARDIVEEADPKAAVLLHWACAWSSASRRRITEAEATLLDGAEAMIAVQHTYFAAKLAHCAVRLGGASERAQAVLAHAQTAAGGGMIGIMSEHARAMAEHDAQALEAIAEDLTELGMASSAADTWLALAQQASANGASELDERRWRVRASSLRAAHPGLPLWRQAPSSSEMLSPREYEVAALAAQRHTTKEIAAQRGVSPSTVNNQLTSAFRKLGVSGRAELREVWAGLEHGVSAK